MAFTILHYRKCSKSRRALEILSESGKEFAVREYMINNLTPLELSAILKKLNKTPKEILRKKEAKEAGIYELDGPELIKKICDNPMTMERPIVIFQDRALICRPPENILDILQDGHRSKN